MVKDEYNSEEELLQERKKRIFSLRSLILVLFSSLVFLLLFYNTDFDEVYTLFIKIQPIFLVVTVLIYGASNYLKGLRLRILLQDSQTPLLSYFSIAGFHNFYNQILPARTGELTLVYYLKRYAGVKAGVAVYSLIVVRILDLVVVAIYFFISFMMLTWGNIDLYWLLPVLILGFLAVLSLLLLPLFVVVAKKLVLAIVTRFSLRGKLIGKLVQMIESVEQGVSASSVKGLFLPLTIVTLLIWAALYALYYVTIIAVGVDVSPLQSIAGSTGAILTNVLPVNGVGGFGSHEAGWAGGFVLVGLTKEIAIATALTSHLIVFFCSVFFFVISVLLQKFYFKR